MKFIRGPNDFASELNGGRGCHAHRVLRGPNRLDVGVRFERLEPEIRVSNSRKNEFSLPLDLELPLKFLGSVFLRESPEISIPSGMQLNLADVHAAVLRVPHPRRKKNSSRLVKTVDASVGRKGTFKGGVLSWGTTIVLAAGVTEAINFQDADSGNAAATGDFVLTAEEVNPVISELEVLPYFSDRAA